MSDTAWKALDRVADPPPVTDKTNALAAWSEIILPERKKLDYQPRMAELAKQGKLSPMRLGHVANEMVARELDYQTPESVLKRVRLLFPEGRIQLDPATANDNPTNAVTFYTADMDKPLASPVHAECQPRCGVGVPLPGRNELPCQLPELHTGACDPKASKRHKRCPFRKEARHAVGGCQCPCHPAGGLWRDWNAPWFVNPPYGAGMPLWIAKIGEEAGRGRGVALLPVNRTETSYWQDCIAGKAHQVCWIRKRVAFIRPSTGKVAKGNPYASAVWNFGFPPGEFRDAMGPLGRVCAS